MKKIYLLLLFCLPLSMVAQNVTTADLPYAGQAFLMGHDTTYSTTMLAGGANQTWDYSTLINQANDTVGFGTSAGTPYVSSFPNSTLVGHKPWDTNYTYFHGNGTGFYIDGLGRPSGNFVYGQPSLYFPVPFTYGNSRSNYSYIQVDTVYNAQNVRVRLSNFETFNADGNGTLILPSGTYTNVLRVKETVLTYDSISIYVLGSYIPFSASASQSTNYLFMKPSNDPVYILGITADSLGTTTLTSDYFISTYNGIDEQKISRSTVYPNPAISSLSIQLGNQLMNATLEVYDAQGKIVIAKKDLSGDLKDVNVSTLPVGYYTYRIINGKEVSSGNFQVQR